MPTRKNYRLNLTLLALLTPLLIKLRFYVQPKNINNVNWILVAKGYLGDVLPSQSLGLVTKNKLNLTQQKQPYICNKIYYNVK